MRKLLPVLFLGLSLAGCAGDGSPAPATAALQPGLAPVNPVPVPVDPALKPGGIRGLLVRAPDGGISLIDGEPPTGFTVLADTEVRVVGTDLRVRSSASGHLSIDAPPGLHHILVTPPGVVLQVPSFSPEAGPPVQLALFPHYVRLLDGQTLAMRAVGQDALGRFTPVDGVQWEELEIDPTVVPDTSSLNKTLPSSVVGGQAPGLYEVRARSQSLTGKAEMLEAASVVTGALQGQLVNGPNVTVKVEGTSLTTTTDAQGNFFFPQLPPVVAELSFFNGSQLVGLGQVGIQSGRLTTRSFPLLNVGYTPRRVLAAPEAAGVAVRPNGDILVGSGQRIKVFSSSGAPLPDLNYAFQRAQDVAADFAGTPSATDSGDGRAVVIETTTTRVLGTLRDPLGVAADAGGNVYVTDFTGNEIHRFQYQQGATYSPSGTFGGAVLNHPQGLAISRAGEIYVADRGDNQVEVFNLGGQPLRSWSVQAPLDVAVDKAGGVYVLTSTEVVRFSRTGALIGRFPTPANPQALAVNGVGGEVWVTAGGAAHEFAPDTAPAELPPPALPPPTGTSLVQDASFQALEQSFQQLLQEFEIPGGSLSLSVNGRLVIHRAYGYSRQSVSQAIPAQPDDLWRIASCSKSFAAVTLLIQLQNQPVPFALATRPFAPGGLLRGLLTSDPVDLAGLELIEVQHLLQMSAGLNDPTALYSPFARTLGNPPPATAAQLASYILVTAYLGSPNGQKPFAPYQPGSTYVYSDVAYLAIGRLVEAVGGTTYGTALRNLLLVPSGMGRIRISNTRLDGAVPGEVTYYPASGQTGGQSVFTNEPQIVPTPYGAVWDGLAHDSCGGLIASTGELVRFLNTVGPNNPPGFVNPLTPATVAQMSARPPFSPAAASYFGMGWNFTADGGGNVLTMSKDGALPGTMAFMQWYPPTRVGWAITFNSEPGPGTKVSDYAIGQFTQAVNAFVQAENASGGWPAAGDLFPTLP